ncbi:MULTISPECIES: hypothetical protein [unclassified Neisseria]|uniref:hypothetical protein n=1 Tax=unclassified Neisseria TaxID=2623750 RepID=UPI001072D6BB|nr:MULTISPECIES: hypothetical protein [unclassified Neisseria]MBF0804955.1 hypothetical protein [Neisseria sp. 19428wB4_WF04]TFU39332.1 hypothetical protein E4T99_11670 [Neisseria sp. WF04]
MNKSFFLLATALFALSGCLGGRTTTITLPEQTQAPSDIPRQIQYRGETYRLQGRNETQAEYYREGEQGYQWKKLITLHKQTGTVPLGTFAGVMTQQLKHEHARYEIVPKKNALQVTVVYLPKKGHPHFKDHEVNLMHYRQSPCGFTGLQYAERHAAGSDAGKLLAAGKRAQTQFQTYAADLLSRIDCPVK